MGRVLLCALLAGCCFWLGLGKEPPSYRVNRAAASAISLPAPQTRPIEAVRVGQRVIARNPELGEAERSTATAVDPATWRKLRLVADNRWEDGTVDPIEVETLQPPEWVAKHGAHVGALVPIPLDLVEMGLPEGLHARVMANDPCPSIEPGPGKVVLTTVNHLNRDVWEVTLTDDQGRSERVRPTGLHKFYSQSRGEWVSTRDLRPCEQLSGLRRPLTVTRVQRIPGVHRVYNMTVEGEHVYHVSTLAVVAHNLNCAERADAAARRHGGIRLEEKGHYRFPSRRAARQAASEIAGNMGRNVEPIHLKDFRGVPPQMKNSMRVIGRSSKDGSVWWRDDFLGHPRFGAGPHINVHVDGIDFHLWY
ncbi:polymorphic toxin-type HINT domain-containing protein [Thermopirellula anaerolimosa]